MRQTEKWKGQGWIPDVLYSVLLGLGFMQLIVGLDKINPSNTNWLLIRGSDLSYHYLAWEYFKDSPWSWPPGQLVGYAYPMYNSIMYTDSIPLLAFLFKSLRGILPIDFQYFGFWYALCFVLNTRFGLALMKQAGWSRGFRWLIAPFFTGAVVLVARFGHAALCGQWVLLDVCLIYLKAKTWTIARTYSHLYAVVFLTSLIHPYLLFMVLALSVTPLLQLTWEKRIPWTKIPLYTLLASVLALTGWTLSGAFLFKGQLSEGLGKYSANLNTYFNAWDVGRLGPSFPYYDQGQGEGIAYLGLGVILLILLVAGASLLRGPSNPLPSRANRSGSINFFFLGSVLFFVFALSPKWAFGNHLIVDWAYNDYISRTFRGTGRFTWPLYYFILYYTFMQWHRLSWPGWVKFLCLSCMLLVQAVDLSPLWKRKPYIDSPPSSLQYVDQFKRLIASCDKVLVYPPYLATIADYWDYIDFTNLAQQAGKPITTGYGARLPEHIGRAFRDSVNNLSAYLASHPGDLVITHVDSLNLHQALIQKLGGQSFQFERYRVYAPEALIKKIDLNGIDPSSMERIRTQQPVRLQEYLESKASLLIAGSVYEEGLGHLGESTKQYLKEMGSHTDSLRYGASWAFLIQNRKFIREAISMTDPVSLSDSFQCQGHQTLLELESGGYQAGKKISIRLGGEERSSPTRGLTLVVLDSCGRFVEKVRFDTYLSDAFLIIE
ncbi:MAG TPA: DUF6311 domain-containing protein [Saprospiraceae bacterium]|nr:DUF6311 domain-containing protein [Saprospiraceae bacterium]HNT22542.1 DUF6311 domain-containing protein [Saprospiraceae bacterium]